MSNPTAATPPPNNDESATKKILVQDMKQMTAKDLERPPFSYLNKMYQAFSKVEAPSGHDGKPWLRLVTIRISHFCEKARWALDYAVEDEESPYGGYTEDAHPPGFQALETVPASKGTCSVTPMVLTWENTLKPSNDSTVQQHLWTKSDEILQHFCPRWYPKEIANEVKALEQDWNHRLGSAVRAYAYSNLLQDKNRPALINMLVGDCAMIEKVLFPRVLPMVKKVLHKELHINKKNPEETMDHCQETIRDVFARASQLLQDNKQEDGDDQQPFLLGTSLTAADVTLAALSSPLLRPAELAAFQCPDSQLPPAILAFKEELRSTPAGQHVLHLYRQHRFPPTNNNNSSSLQNVGRQVLIRTGPRNRLPWFGIAGAGAIGLGLAMAVSASQDRTSRSSKL